jgi:uncharacterized protein YchJ
MKPLIVTLLIIFGVIIVVGLGSVLLVLWAYGAGQVMLRVLPSGTFTPFEATLLNQVGVLIVGLMVIRVVSSATAKSLTPKALRKDVEKEQELSEDEIIENEADEFAGIPRWRRPLKNLDFTDVKPNDPCPCGSGRKFQNCHGYKRSEVK